LLLRIQADRSTEILKMKGKFTNMKSQKRQR